MIPDIRTSHVARRQVEERRYRADMRWPEPLQPESDPPYASSEGLIRGAYIGLLFVVMPIVLGVIGLLGMWGWL